MQSKSISATAGARVERGDRVVSVNGVEHVKGIVEELRKGGVLDLVVERAASWRRAIDEVPRGRQASSCDSLKMHLLGSILACPTTRRVSGGPYQMLQ